MEINELLPASGGGVEMPPVIQMDLAGYFTETWFNGEYVQIPIFIYGFFN